MDTPASAPGHPSDHQHPHEHQHDHPHDHSSTESTEGTEGKGPVADASVRIGRVSDAPAVGLVQALVWREAYAAHLPDDVVAQFEPRGFTNAWRSSLERPPSRDHLLLVACAGEQVVGFAAVAPSDDPDLAQAGAELLVLGVHPEARRQGHGSRLLNAAVDTARGRGRTSLATWILADSVLVRDFLHAAGLESDGAQRERVVSAAGDTVWEVRLGASVTQE